MCNEKFNHVVNLTMNEATSSQRDAGVMSRTLEDAHFIIRHLEFNKMPSAQELRVRAKVLANRANSMIGNRAERAAMIDGEPFLMSRLEEQLKELKIQPLYAFTKWEPLLQTDDTYLKKPRGYYKHIGFIKSVEGIVDVYRKE